MIKTLKHNKLNWIDIENPKAKEILILEEKFKLHPLVLEEFTSPSQRPRAEEFHNCLYIVMHVPLFDKKKRVTTAGELDIVLTKNTLITSHVEENIPIKLIIRELEKNEIELQKAMGNDVGFMLYFVLEKLLSSCFPKIDHINEQLNEIERQIFEDNEKEMVKETSIVKRDILAFRRTLKPQRSILESLANKNYKLLDNNLNKYLQDLIGTNIRVWNALENTKEVIESLEETNNSLVSYKINETMRLLTAISFITFALSVTVGIFGMAPFQNFEASQEKSTFWIVIGLMSFIIFSLLLIFKKKKWI